MLFAIVCMISGINSLLFIDELLSLNLISSADKSILNFIVDFSSFYYNGIICIISMNNNLPFPSRSFEDLSKIKSNPNWLFESLSN